MLSHREVQQIAPFYLWSCCPMYSAPSVRLFYCHVAPQVSLFLFPLVYPQSMSSSPNIIPDASSLASGRAMPGIAGLMHAPEPLSYAGHAHLPRWPHHASLCCPIDDLTLLLLNTSRHVTLPLGVPVLMSMLLTSLSLCQTPGDAGYPSSSHIEHRRP